MDEGEYNNKSVKGVKGMNKKENRKFVEEKVRLHTEVRGFAKRIQPIYQLLNWTWGKGIPTIGDIEEKLHELIMELAVNITSVESGGLKIAQDRDGKVFCGLEMIFKADIDFFRMQKEEEIKRLAKEIED